MNEIRLPWEHEPPRSVAGRVAASLAQAIVESAIEPGTLLTELDVAARCAASRTPVREAFLQLEAWGLVQLLPKKGALVTTVSRRMRRDLLDVRAMWEEHAVQVSAAQSTSPPQAVETLQDLLGQQAGALAAGDLLRFASLDFAFHMGVIQLADNEVMNRLTAQLGPQLARLTYAAATESPAVARALYDDHKELLTLVTARDAAGYAAAVRAHIQRGHFTEEA